MSLAIWSLAAQNVFIAFGPWRHKMFHCTLWSLAAQNVSLYLLVPGGKKSINMRPLQGRFSQYPDPGRVISCYLAPGGIKCFIVPFGPWRDKMFHCTTWSLAAQNVFIVPFGPWRDKMFHCTLRSLAG
ncbi:MAG: hypothetical protein ACK5F6_02400 [Bacteroidota bacterium]